MTKDELLIKYESTLDQLEQVQNNINETKNNNALLGEELTEVYLKDLQQRYAALEKEKTFYEEALAKEETIKR